MTYDVPAWLRITQIEHVTAKVVPVIAKPEKTKPKKVKKKGKVQYKFDLYCKAFAIASETTAKDSAEACGIKYPTLMGVLQGRSMCHVKKHMNSIGIYYTPKKYVLTDDQIKEAYRRACEYQSITRAAVECNINRCELNQIIKGNYKPSIKKEMDADGIVYLSKKRRIPDSDVKAAIKEAVEIGCIREAARNHNMHESNLRLFLNGKRRPWIYEEMKQKGVEWNRNLALVARNKNKKSGGDVKVSE